ncbi:hypothetical protein D9758_015548 [Tetrapyrgos nigripes]|uniref:IucC family-domain-containing protein n=1 Tax=Tetrapyrgos nigripes TaxID=182062 RepID=A0A8H5C3W0_9AGAR|nr:hypothetical protein D9758_015548 [Tetrapyrgos nigripes]
MILGSINKYQNTLPSTISPHHLKMSTTEQSLLPPAEHAAFAVSSRLLSCLVTESLLRSFYLPLPRSRKAAGLLVVLATSLISEQPVITRVLKSTDVFAIVPLRHPPVLKDQHLGDKHGSPVALVDPLDMLPEIYELSSSYTEGESIDNELSEELLSVLTPPPWEIKSATMRRITSPRQLWNKFVEDMLIQDSLRNVIESELLSSLHWQTLSFENPPKCPSLSSSPIEWEQSLVAGHPTHPMHRARMMPKVPDSYDWYHPIIRFVRVLGPFVKTVHALAQSAALSAGLSLPDSDDSVIMPVHEAQLDNILSKFPDVEALDPAINVRAEAQCSIRTVSIPELPGMALKLAVGVKISSSLRTISHFTANFGPRFSEEIVPKLAINPELLAVETEPSTAVYKCANPDDAKNFTAVLRKTYSPAPNEAVITVAALLETGHAGAPPGVSAIEHIFGLDSMEKRTSFLDRYIEVACKALVPPLMHNGVAFEAHAQNVLARFDVQKKELLGFVVRDLGGLRIHPDTLNKSLGTNFVFLDGHCVATASVEEAYPKFYHTLFHNHLQRLIRLLGMHYNGVGWEMLRRHLTDLIPPEHGLYKHQEKIKILLRATYTR